MTLSRPHILPILILSLIGTNLLAENWPNWRGPRQNGTAGGEGYATEWTKTDNILWKYALPGRGASTPAIWESKIFLSYGTKGANIALCLNRNGEEIWKETVGKARDGKHKKASPANSSPVTDGKHVYFYFKSGDLACLDMDGKTVWNKNLQAEYGEDTLWWDLGTSPVLVDNKVIVACVQSGPSYVAAFDKMTGKELWKQKRELNAPEEANQSYSTPMVVDRNGKKELIVLGADYVTSHNLDNGEELWRVGDLNPTNHKYFRSIASPVSDGERVYAPYARGDSLTAIDLGGNGDVTDSHTPWKIDFSADVPTPAISGKRMYVLRDKHEIVCVATESGKTLWKGMLEKHRAAYSASPVVADGKVYVTREDGKTFVVADSDKFEILGSSELGEQTVATPVLLDGRIYLRTYKNLYCIGN